MDRRAFERRQYDLPPEKVYPTPLYSIFRSLKQGAIERLRKQLIPVFDIYYQNYNYVQKSDLIYLQLFRVP